MKKLDIHAHYGKWPFVGKDSSVADIIKIIKKYDTEAIFLSSSKALMYDFREGNRELFDDIENADGLYGYVVVNSNYPKESLDEIKKYLSHKKFIGAKYHPDYFRKPADCSELNPIYDYLEKNNIPILIHTFGEGISSPMRLLNVNRRYPEITLIAAHMGGSRFDVGINLGEQSNDNVFLEFCSTDASSDKLKKAVDAVGEERVLYGTDYSLFDPSYSIGAVESSGFSDSIKEMIYRTNAQKIFKRYGK